MNQNTNQNEESEVNQQQASRAGSKSDAVFLAIDLEDRACLLLEALPEGTNTVCASRLDEYELELCESLTEEGLLRKWCPIDAISGRFVTTEAGREWLLSYVNGGHR